MSHLRSDGEFLRWPPKSWALVPLDTRLKPQPMRQSHPHSELRQLHYGGPDIHTS